MNRASLGIKRAVDIVVAAMSCILLTPLMALIAIAIIIDSPGPVLYASRRLGRNGKPFTMLKFRSMYAGSPTVRNADHSLRVDHNDGRVTRVGRVLRSGWDELPQFWNVFKGDMSLVGPRPDPEEARDYYEQGDEKRLELRPGMTGLAQVAGRTGIPWRERVKYDLFYVDHVSLLLDLRIALRTILEVAPFLRGLIGSDRPGFAGR